ncbi:MAG: methionine--tRNA ligase [Candidatus Lokiarchaeota archaeon]|nr:methionine--tRNA ligase [Candidatus Lokiarchaeota archaeon]MBD3201275.1 methionine--tRNA ligase [Candidatus Lokiarchaeota archaeon]
MLPKIDFYKLLSFSLKHFRRDTKLTNKKKQKWVVTSAWPYVNATPHLGNLIGSVLSADVFARYLRLKGDEVVYVSGSDMHGTPVAVTAKKEGIKPQELAMNNHQKIKELFQAWQISYDNYTQTHNETHIDFVQKFYLDIQKNGYINEKEIQSLYCSHDKFYLPDRFVEGICPHCGFEDARGDQCDQCQKLLTPLDLKEPRCAICDEIPEIRKTKHWYMNFPKLQDELTALIEKNDIIPQNAKQVCLNSIKEGLPERAITRDLKWGIPAPFEGAEEKTIYVWFEAVLGYVSAVKEWAKKQKSNPEQFNYFWKDSETKTVYFIGKDNIIFHLIVFPGLLMAYNKDKAEDDKLVLPYNVSSTEWLMYENDKFSKSRGIGIWIDEALELAPLDYWRFNLVYNRPERSDTSFLWSEFENNINTLNDVIGNFIHRILTFIHKQYESKVPERIDLDERDIEFLSKITSISEKVELYIDNFELRKSIREIVEFAREGNIYLNDKAPWHIIRNNKKAAGHVFNLCAQMVYALAILLGPFIPDTSRKILSFLNFNEDLNKLGWHSISKNAVNAGTKIKKPIPVFQKLDVSEIKDKLDEIKQSKSKDSKVIDMIEYNNFKKLDIRIATVEEVEDVPKADKLYKLTINVGEEKRTLAAGLAEYYKPEELIGKKIAVLVNLEPKKLRGVLSQGMLLAAVDGENVSVLTPDKDIPSGAKIE